MSGNLFSAGSVFNVPFGAQTQWSVNQQMQGVPLVVNTPGSGFDIPIYTATASDPTVTVTGAQNSLGNSPDVTLHIPAGAQPASGSDHTLEVISGGEIHSFWNFQWTGPNSATAGLQADEATNGSGVIDAPSGQFDGSNYDFGVGTMTGADLSQAASTGVINHLLRIAIPTTLAKSVSSNWQQLASYAGPQTAEDGFGPSVYSGTLPYGVTVGIPKGIAEPAAIKANAGANILWNTLQQYGAMVRDTDGTSGTTALYTDQTVSDNNPLVQGMDQYGAQIASYLQVVTNESSTMIKGNPGSNWVANATSGSGGTPGGSGNGGSTGGGGSTGSGSGSGSGSSSGGSSGAQVILPGAGPYTLGGHSYSLTTGDVAMEDGKPIPGGGGTGEMELYNNQVYGLDAVTLKWYTWNQQDWTPAAAPGGGTGGVTDASPSGTVITPGHGTITDDAGNLYILTAAKDAEENGKLIPGGGNTAKMEFLNGKVEGQDASTHQWYIWNQHDWVQTTPPPVTAAASAVQPQSTHAAALVPTQPEHVSVIPTLHS